jgi:DNA-binding CsgD family transcriptional regulator
MRRLLAAIASALERSRAQRTGRAERQALNARFNRLTPRERAVCALVAAGVLNKHVAAELGASEKTVKVHRGRVMAKLEVTSVAELVRLFDRVREPGWGARRHLAHTERTRPRAARGRHRPWSTAFERSRCAGATHRGGPCAG